MNSVQTNCFLSKLHFGDFCGYGPFGPRRVLFKNLNKTDTIVKH